MNRDTKQLFGDLLETNKMRKKRLKVTDENPEVERDNDNIDRLKPKIKPIAKGNILVCIM